MFFVYVDESGDDGFPGSSDTFINSAVQIESKDWNIFDKRIVKFREKLNVETKFLNKYEIHTKHIIDRKKPFYSLNLTDDEIKKLFREYAEFLSKQKISITNVVIDKTKIKKEFRIFDKGVDYLLNRINTTISVKYRHYSKDDKYFLVFVDKGRIGNWESLVKRMKQNNLLKTKKRGSHNIPLKKMIEKPIQRDSHKSHLLQVSDFVATIIHKYYRLKVLNIAPRSKVAYFDLNYVEEILDILKPILNTDACKKNKYGIVYFPEK